MRPRFQPKLCQEKMNRFCTSNMVLCSDNCSILPHLPKTTYLCKTGLLHLFNTKIDDFIILNVSAVAGLVGDSPLREGLVQGFLLILFSELGDKTFFIAVLLALKQNKGIVFGGTFGALAVMSVISVSHSLKDTFGLYDLCWKLICFRTTIYASWALLIFDNLYFFSFPDCI